MEQAWNAWNDESTANERGEDDLGGGGGAPGGAQGQGGVPEVWGAAVENPEIQILVMARERPVGGATDRHALARATETAVRARNLTCPEEEKTSRTSRMLRQGQEEGPKFVWARAALLPPHVMN